MKIETSYTDEIKSFVNSILCIKKETYGYCFVFLSSVGHIGFSDNPNEEIPFTKVSKEEFIKTVEQFI